MPLRNDVDLPLGSTGGPFCNDADIPLGSTEVPLRNDRDLPLGSTGGPLCNDADLLDSESLSLLRNGAGLLGSTRSLGAGLLSSGSLLRNDGDLESLGST